MTELFIKYPDKEYINDIWDDFKNKEDLFKEYVYKLFHQINEIAFGFSYNLFDGKNNFELDELNKEGIRLKANNPEIIDCFNQLSYYLETNSLKSCIN